MVENRKRVSELSRVKWRVRVGPGVGSGGLGPGGGSGWWVRGVGSGGLVIVLKSQSR